MRIQSKFKDFYDSVQKYTYGESPTYVRNWCRTFQMKPLPMASYHDSQFLVGFCGTLYYGVQSRRYLRTNPDVLNVKYHFNVDDYLNYIRPNYLNTKEDVRKFSIFFKQEVNDEPFIKENAPILFVDYDNRMSCPLETKNRTHEKTDITLESIGFDLLSKEDAYTLLCGYVGGVLASEHKSIPEMTDQVKIDSHGFDKKSFRKSK